MESKVGRLNVCIPLITLEIRGAPKLVTKEEGNRLRRRQTFFHYCPAIPCPSPTSAITTKTGLISDWGRIRLTGELQRRVSE